MRPGRKPQRPVFSHLGSIHAGLAANESTSVIDKYKSVHETVFFKVKLSSHEQFFCQRSHAMQSMSALYVR